MNDAFWLPDPAEICTVQQIVTAAGRLLEKTFNSVWIEGEVRNAKMPSSGHVYFTLSDERSQLRAVCFRSTLRLLDFTPEDGSMVLVRGRLAVYEPRGDLQLIVDDMEPLGDGLQRLQFEELKRKLAAEGLFSPERKRPLPKLPRGVGVVTSPTGAAVRDIIKVMNRRAPGVPIFVSPAKVQGDGAPEELVQALKIAEEHHGLDVIIIGRGGGGAQDLAAFNDEKLTRAVADCRVPVISAVGHEIDFSLVDLAADVRAATPSMAAELAVKEWTEWTGQIANATQLLHSRFKMKLKTFGRLVESKARLLTSPQRKIDRLSMRLDAVSESIEKKRIEALSKANLSFSKHFSNLAKLGPEHKIAFTKEKISALKIKIRSTQTESCRRASVAVKLREAQLAALNPLSVLERGYSIVTKADGQIVKDAKQCELQEQLTVNLARGGLDCRVSSIFQDNGTES